MRHPASEGFAAVAGEYDRARPGYPIAAIAWLAHEVGLGHGSHVIDVAAGTGKLTEALAPLGATITAVEPVDEMRAVLERRMPGVVALAGVAEALPVADGTADAVVVGQAYHWFAGEPALSEFQRVLRPGGVLALVWNARDLTRPVWRELAAIADPLRGSAPSHDGHAWRESLEHTERFAPQIEQSFPNRQLVTREGLVERVASTSFVGALEPGERAPLLERVRELAAAHPEPIELDYVAEVFVLARRDT